MEASEQKALKVIMDLEKVNRFNAQGCPACGRKFSLGEMAVLACGFWEDGPKYIHENEAVFDKKTATYIERRCYNAGRQGYRFKPALP